MDCLEIQCDLLHAEWQQRSNEFFAFAQVLLLDSSNAYLSPESYWPGRVVEFVLKTSSLCRSDTVNSKSFVGKVLLQIKWKFELINAL